MKTSTMTCPDPEKLSELAFMAAAGRDLLPNATKTLAHMDRCESCTALYSEWVAIAISGRESLVDVVATSPCPEENTIAEYFDGVLSGADHDRVEEHMAACGSCVRQLCELHSLLLESSRPAPLRRIALEWLQEGLRVIEASTEAFRPIALAPAPVLKGNDIPSSFSWEAEQEGYTLRITVQRSSGEHLTLHLFLKHGEAPESGRRIFVRCDGELIESRRTKEDGTMVLFGLAVANYDVEIDIPGGPLTFSIEFPVAN
jgi:hypothetical protein